MDPLGLVCDLTNQQFKNKLKRIRNQIAAGGNKGIKGTVSEDDALKLGKQFLGENYSVKEGCSAILLVSEDGLRKYRGPAVKKGINKVTGEVFSKTGRQVNFQSRSTPDGAWVNNVHLDVE